MIIPSKSPFKLDSLKMRPKWLIILLLVSCCSLFEDEESYTE